MSDLTSVWARIVPERLTELLVKAVDHYSPSFAEEPAMEVFAESLDVAGIGYHRQMVPGRYGQDQRGNLVVELGPRPAHFLWVGHVDTIPVIDETDQSTRREGDTLYGLGTADMKSGCAAVVEALVALSRSGVELERGLCVALVVGEEEYGDGSETLLERVSAPLAVIGEPTGLRPCVDHYGYYEYLLTSRGAAAHAALPELGASAIHAMLTWLTHILDQGARPPYLDRVAMNPREIRGGADLFVVADSCEAQVDIHTAPGLGAAEIRDLIDSARRQALSSHPRCELDYEQIFGAEGYTYPGEDGRLMPLRRAFEAAGLTWTPTAFRSHSDGPLFHGKGMLPVICGPGSLEVAHTRGERVSLKEVESAARLYAAMMYEACVR